MLGSNKLCAVAAASDARSLSRQLSAALRQTRSVELRLDWLSSDREIARFLRHLAAHRPRALLIATCRRVQAGGRYRGTVAKQLLHLAEAIRAGCAWYDLEIETIRQCPAELLDVLLGEGRRLASAHFFRGLPENLSQVAAELERSRPDAIKIAAQCDSLGEARKLLRFAKQRKSIVAVPMGDVALPARLLSVRMGSAFTYAPVEEATAPGQVSLEQMKMLYRGGEFSRRTRVYGVIGDPVMHSLSPQIQNAAFQARRMDAVHLPFLVQDLRDFVTSLEAFSVRGFSVTLPHKQAILRYLDECDPLAARIGAVNTVAVRAGGKLHGYDTDYLGVLRSLEPRISLRGSRVLILGAGGAARAASFALAQAGAAVYICARRPARARALARDVGSQAILWSRVRHESFDVIVNATPVGMHPHAENSPLAAEELNCRLVFDTIYRPRTTRLLQMAARRGIQTVSGVEMFVAQGAAQFKIWTGQSAPAGVMHRVLELALAREEKKEGMPAPQRKARSRR